MAAFRHDAKLWQQLSINSSPSPSLSHHLRSSIHKLCNPLSLSLSPLPIVFASRDSWTCPLCSHFLVPVTMLSLPFLLCTALALAASALALAVPRAVSGFPDPTVDPFYSQPGNIATYSLGQIIDTRATVSTFAGPNLKKSYQIKFRSQNAQNQPIAAVTTVLVPTKRALSSSGDASMLSFQNFQDSVTLSCSPSWAYVANSGSPAALAANLEAPIVNGWALEQGHTVVIPDHEG